MRSLAITLVSCGVAAAQPQPVPPLRVVVVPAAVAIDAVRRGVLVPFEIGDDLPDGTVVEYIAELMNGDRVLSQVKGRAPANRGRLVSEVKMGAPPTSPRVRLTARALNRDGVAVATVHVPQENPQHASCGGLVFEQAVGRRGVRDFSRGSAVTISTLVSADGLTGTVAPLRFGLGPVGTASQKFWPVQLGIPLRNQVWRVAFTLRAPLPAGPLEVRLLRDDKPLPGGCSEQFNTY